jgi:hypothetical protein
MTTLCELVSHLSQLHFYSLHYLVIIARIDIMKMNTQTVSEKNEMYVCSPQSPKK